MWDQGHPFELPVDAVNVCSTVYALNEDDEFKCLFSKDISGKMFIFVAPVSLKKWQN